MYCGPLQALEPNPRVMKLDSMKEYSCPDSLSPRYTPIWYPARLPASTRLMKLKAWTDSNNPLPKVDNPREDAQNGRTELPR